MAPQVNDPFRLDGFDYVLTKVGARTEFQRPEGLAKGDTPYRIGECKGAELVWVEPHDWLSLVDEQGYALARGRPLMTLWAQACMEALREKAPTTGAWMLAGRHLPKFRGTEVPLTTADARKAARAALNLPERPDDGEE